MSAGWIGVVLTMGMVGTVLGLAHRWFWRRIQSNVAVLFYVVFLAMLPQWYRDGGISILKFAFWNLTPLLVWLALTWLLGERRMATANVLLPSGAQVRFVSGK